MIVRTLTDLEVLVSRDEGATWDDTRVDLPAGTFIADIEFEGSDREVGILSGAAVGTTAIDGTEVFVDCGGDRLDWWGEAGDVDVPGWFEEVPEAERLDDAELRALAEGLVTNRVYLLPADDPDFNMVFMVTALTTLPWGVGAAYEDIAKAGPRSVNGKPIFFSCKLLHYKDGPALATLYEEMLNAIAQAGTTPGG